MDRIPVQIIELAKKYREKIAFDFKIKKMFIFGSYAKGNYEENSDIDICIIAEGINNNYIAMSKALLHIIGIDLRIEPVVFSLEEYNQEPSFGLLKEIKKYGVEI